MTILGLVIIALAAAWVGWRLYSKRALLPCPAGNASCPTT
jgi:hypothetical protein